MAMYRYFKRKERNSDKLPYYNLGLPSVKIKTANSIFSTNISGYMVYCMYVSVLTYIGVYLNVRTCM